MVKKYSEDELTRAILLIIDQGFSPSEAARQTGINLRAIQRYKKQYVDEKTPDYPTTQEIAVAGEVPAMNPKVNEEVYKTIIARAKFLDEVFETKQVVLKQIRKVSGKSQNLDAMQRTLKTLSDIEKEVVPDGNPVNYAKTLNVFNIFNQQLIQDGYKGPELSDADIVKGD